MKRIVLKQLTLVNFKGLKSLVVDFNSGVTEIFGTNGTGKTTIKDGFLFLLFGKDSAGRSDFGIKTLTEDNKVIEKLDHEVSGVFTVNGKEITLRRCYREKWQKKRGSEEAEMNGHETLYWIDGVPAQAGEYQAYISSLVDEQLFRMITNPLYFNSLKWEERRKVITQLAGEVSDEDIAATKEQFAWLLKELSGKSLELFLRHRNEIRKKLKEELALLPARIDEATRSIPQEPDYASIETSITEKQAELNNIDAQISDVLKISEGILAKEKERQQKIYGLETELNRLNHEANEKANVGTRQREENIRNLKGQIEMYQKNIDNNKSMILSKENVIKIFEKQLAELRETFTIESEKLLKYEEGQFNCPTCKRPYEAHNVEAKKEEMTANFNRAKVEKCNQINARGKELKDSIALVTKDIDNIRAESEKFGLEIEAINKKLQTIQSQTETQAPIDDSFRVPYDEQITALKAEEYTAPDTTELKASKQLLQSEVNTLRDQLAVKALAERSRNRVKELEKDLKDKAQQLASTEKEVFIAEEFDRTKANVIENRVNEMFKTVRFKMFNQLINGSLEPTCEAIVNGVNWPDVNTAGRINAGLDIINTLCKFYHVAAPIFVDNSESVVRLLDGEYQVIKLIVSKEHPKLTIIVDSVSENAKNVTVSA